MITKDFVTAGHAIFTVSNPTGEHFTYRVSAPRDFNEESPVWFLSVLTGPNNQSDYTYAGLLFETGAIRQTKGSKIGPDAKSWKVAAWALKQVWEGNTLPAGYDIKHEGRCGKCGRPLTDPVSIETGLGPICAGRE